MKTRWILLIAAAVAATTALRISPPDQAGPSRGQDDPLAPRSKGSAAAPVTVYEMSDFQCPFCRRHAVETLPILEDEYIKTGKIRWVFVNFPIPQLHPNAVPAAQVAMCAARQDAFWPVHDLLFLHQDVWGPLASPGEFLLSLADSVRIDRDSLGACLEAQATLDQVRVDAQGAVQAGATSTPTFYIEGGLLVGAHPVEVFRVVLDSIISEKKSRSGR